MTIDTDPIVEIWYQHLDKGDKFWVVAIDEDKELVEIQYFDGDLEEIDLDSWYEMEVESIAAPEDWTGPLDDMEDEDLDAEINMKDDNWARLQNLSPKQADWENEPSDDEDDAASDRFLGHDSRDRG